MKASDLNINELLDYKDGVIELKGRRLVLHSLNAFAQLRKDLFDNLEFEQVRAVFTRFGFFWGQADAAAMKRLFSWDDLQEWIKASAVLLSLEGVGKVSFEKLIIEKEKNNFLFEILMRNSGEAEEHLLEIGKSNSSVCWIITGYLSGYISFCLSQNIYFNETKCRAKNDKICFFTGKDENSWGSEIGNILKNFKEEDIKTKVKNLTEELKIKSKEIELQKRKIDQLQNIQNEFFVEIHSRSFKNIIETAARVARFDTSVLITGETGTGKEVLARFIHKNSERADGPFIAINCTALPETLLESELFGYKKGAFTGASSDRTGLFEEANNGTIFLDEIGDISKSMQLKLLRVLQEKEIIRIGENKPRKINTRIISATNRNLENDVKSGKFRQDLYFRIKVIEIRIPPLRERTEDILPLARYFIKKLEKKLKIKNLRLDSTVIDYLVSYNWPGNVRELENILESAAILSDNGTIKPEHLPHSILKNKNDLFAASNSDTVFTLKQLEQKHIEKALNMFNGNKQKAAKFLGISPVTLWRKLKKI